MEMIKQFFNDESGATMVEYAILVALISVVAIAIIVIVGGQVQSAFQAVSDQLTAGGINPPEAPPAP